MYKFKLSPEVGKSYLLRNGTQVKIEVRLADNLLLSDFHFNDEKTYALGFNSSGSPVEYEYPPGGDVKFLTSGYELVEEVDIDFGEKIRPELLHSYRLRDGSIITIVSVITPKIFYVSNISLDINNQYLRLGYLPNGTPMEINVGPDVDYRRDALELHSGYELGENLGLKSMTDLDATKAQFPERGTIYTCPPEQETEAKRGVRLIDEDIEEYYNKTQETATRHNSTKVDLSLLPMNACLEECKVWMSGREKYGRDNWRKMWGADTINVANASLLRHALKMNEGEIYDQESGLPHAAHIRANAAMIIEYLAREGEIEPTKVTKVGDISK